MVPHFAKLFAVLSVLAALRLVALVVSPESPSTTVYIDKNDKSSESINYPVYMAQKVKKSISWLIEKNLQ